MRSVLLLDVLDVARALGREPQNATAASVANWLLAEYAVKRGGGFNYNPAIAATYDLFRGAITPQEAEQFCLTHGNPVGRAKNAEAVSCVAEYARANISRCYRIGFTAVVVGRASGNNVYIGIKAPMVRIFGREAYVVLPGYRMGYRPEAAEIDVACSIALSNFARDDYRQADFEYLYAGPGATGGREFQSFKGKERTIYEQDAVDALLATYVEGVALVMAAGVANDQPNLRGYQVKADAQQSMF